MAGVGRGALKAGGSKVLRGGGEVLVNEWRSILENERIHQILYGTKHAVDPTDKYPDWLVDICVEAIAPSAIDGFFRRLKKAKS